jgi:glycerol-3-phosphate cytidylyltransferase
MKKVITYGTFDYFHRGHRRIIERAKDLGDYLIVAVTGENYDIERGKLNVRDSLLTRIENVRKTGLADEIIVEEYQGQKINDIAKYNVDILVVGSDWAGKFDYLNKYCEVVYLERTKNVSSTQLRESTNSLYRIGIITDSLNDGDIISENLYISGFDITSVLAETTELGTDFCKKYELGYSFTYSEVDDFLSTADIVYVHTSQHKRYGFAKQALEMKKHIILDFPVATVQELITLFETARKNNVTVSICIPTAHLRTFRQIFSLVHSGMIGDVLRIDCIMPQITSLQDATSIWLLVVMKLLTDRISGLRHDHLESSNVPTSAEQPNISDNVTLDIITAILHGTIASLEISTSSWIQSGMHIIGTNGRIKIPDCWWNMAYLIAETEDNEEPKHYSMNTGGNGFRYLLLDLLQKIRDERMESTTLTNDEAIRIMTILEGAELL